MQLRASVDFKVYAGALAAASARGLRGKWQLLYSVPTGELYKALGLRPLRPWRDALTAYLEERRQRQISHGLCDC
jgi:hypothetical protein